MKRLLTSATMFLCSLLTFAQFSGSGSGTEGDPYLILNPIQLNQVRNFLNQTNVHFKLMADIDLTEITEDEYGTQGWLPIGTSSASFNGIFNGNGKIIKGLYINRPNSDDIGLFGNVVNAKIKDLIIDATSILGKNNVGVLAGRSLNSIYTNCLLKGSIIGDSNVGGCIGKGQKIEVQEIKTEVNIEATNNVGGIIGNIIIEYSENNSISSCRSNIKRLVGNNCIGGILGNVEPISNTNGRISMPNCHVNAAISGNDNVAGICGYGWGVKNVENCSFFGNINGHSFIGGLIGNARSGGLTISKCFAVGQVVGSGDNVGGLCGYTEMSMKQCYYSGSVIGNENVGGLYGQNGYTVWIEKCYSSATVTGRKNVGGICGFTKDASIKSNVSISPLICAYEDCSGRIYGTTEGSIEIGEMGTNKDNKASNRTILIKAGVAQEVEDGQQNGTGVGATTLKLKATYVAMDWNFTDIWEIQETECYPYFKTQTAPPVITSDVVSGATTISGNCVSGATVILDIDGAKQEKTIGGTSFSFTVAPLQAGHEVSVCAKIEEKEQSYFTTAIVSYIGKGTKDDPYQISTAADLTSAYRKGYYKLMNDVDLTDYINQFSPTEGWQSIGRDGSETIHFDGNGNKITGLWCNTTRDNTGLFSCFANGTIKNLTVETANNKQVKGGANTGVLIGKMINGTIENCKVFGIVTDGSPVGGIIGLMDGGKITLSQSSVTINATGKNSYVGGIVGEITGGTIDQCVTSGFYTAEGTESYVGGLIGKNSATVTNCYSNATITSSYNSAGIAAYNYGLIEKCYATGNINSSNYGAGVIGYNDGENAIVRNCVAMNNKIVVTYESQSAQGGGYGQRIIGGFKNGASTPEMNNYALKNMKVSLNNVPQKVYDDIMNGTGKTGEELVLSSTYQELGWDFENVWSVAEQGHYPALKNNIATVSKPSDAVTLTAKSYSRVYGDANPTLEFTSEGGTLNGTPVITCDATATSPVGTYTITIAKGSVTNEDVTLVNGTLTITKAPLIIKAGDYAKKQGEDNPIFVATYEGFKNSETNAVLDKKPVFSCEATKDSPVGEYEITVSGAEATNYEMTYVKGKLTITEAPVTITAKSYTRVYGEANPTFEFTSEGGTLNGTPVITCDATATSPVGTYTITIAKGDVTNEDVTLVNGTLIITKASLTIKAGEYTKKQGEDNPTFVATYEGFKNNETDAVLDKKPVFSCEATKDSPIGEYNVKVSGAEAANYAMTYINGKLNIEPLIFVARSEDGNDNNSVTYQVTTQGDGSTPTVSITSDEGVKGAFSIPETVEHNGTSYKVTEIGESAFENNKDLTDVSIPSSITAIGDKAFKGCSNLKSITVYITTPISLSGAAARGMMTRAGDSSIFDGVDKATCILYVPEGSVELYKAAPVWCEFQNILAIGSTGINGIIMNGEPQEIYDLQGHKVKAKATTLEGLPRGVYIVNGKKIVLK